LVSVSEKSAYHWVFKSFIDEKFILCVTTDILEEYEEIISNHMGTQTANTVLQIIENANNVEFVTKYFRWQLIANDPDDDKFVDCAISTNAKYLVTEDKHFNVLKKLAFPKVSVINLDEFKSIVE